MQKLDISCTPEVKARFRWQQYLAATLATLAALCGGSVLGWTAPVLPYLQGNAPEPGGEPPGNASTWVGPQRPLTDDEASWVGALTPLGALLGALPAGWAADRLGRRRLLLALGALMTASWLGLAFAKNSVWLLLVCRAVQGAVTGAVTVVVPLYSEEIAEPAVRGALGSYLDMMLALGIMWAYTAGAFLSYTWLALSSAALPLVFCALFALMPESPMHLVAEGKWVQAERALAWLRGTTADCSAIQEELHLMAKNVQLAKEPASGPPTPGTPLRPGELPSPAAAPGQSSAGRAARRACVAVFGLMVFQQLSGIDAILFYLVDVFDEAGTSLSPLACTVISGAVQALATGVASLVVDRVGRRPLLLLSAVAMALAHAALALRWAPLFSVNLFLVAFALGLGPMPWFMMAELLPPSAKQWASGAAVALNWSLSFVVTKWFSTLMSALGPSLAYAAFCSVCVVLGVFVTFCVPETRDKTREEIQEELAAP
ncbi:hypothetical protein R5R35_000869 [Gryllus longicercus]